MRDPLGSRGVARRVEVGIEDAPRAAELELEAAALADLQRGGAEPLHKIGSGQSNELAALLWRGRHGHALRQLRLRRRWSGRAAGEQQCGNGKVKAHRRMMAARTGRGKLAGGGRHR